MDSFLYASYSLKSSVGGGVSSFGGTLVLHDLNRKINIIAMIISKIEMMTAYNFFIVPLLSKITNNILNAFSK